MAEILWTVVGIAVGAFVCWLIMGNRWKARQLELQTGRQEEVDGLQAQLTEQRETIASLQGQLTGQRETVASLQGQLKKLQSSHQESIDGQKAQYAAPQKEEDDLQAQPTQRKSEHREATLSSTASIIEPSVCDAILKQFEGWKELTLEGILEVLDENKQFEMQPLLNVCRLKAAQRYPGNQHVEEKLNQQLQFLRDDHRMIRFIGNGRYQLILPSKWN